MVFDETSALEDCLIRKWMDIARRETSGKGIFTAALSGGRTPEGFYRGLAGMKAGQDIWRKTHIFMVDERLVPPDNVDSNFRMIDEMLFSNAPIPKENIHPVSTDCPPEICAGRYASELLDFFNPGEKKFPIFDLILLGLGEDGHTASLFPGTPALKETECFTAAVHDEKKHDRVTLTYPVINSAKNVFFLVTGGKKADVLERIIEKNDPALPASGVNPENGTLLFLADSAAAGRLPAGRYMKML